MSCSLLGRAPCGAGPKAGVANGFGTAVGRGVVGFGGHGSPVGQLGGGGTITGVAVGTGVLDITGASEGVPSGD